MNSDNPASKSPLSIAIAQVALGETASALSTLEDAVQKRSPAAIWLKVAPELEPIRSDPRYEQLLRKMGNP